MGLARALGFRFAWRLVTRQFTVRELEARPTELTDCRCRAVPDCHPSLAFDVGHHHELQYVERRLP